MKWIHKVSLKILLICASSVVALAVTAGTVWAYFKTTTQQAVNQFTPGVIDIEINEPATKYTVPVGEAKKITVTNIHHDEHSAPAYVRVKLIPIMRWDNANDSGSDGTGDEVKNVSYVVNKDWVDGKDGFYYYKEVLPPDGNPSERVMDSITVGDIPPGKKLEIQVIADAVQVSDEATQKAWGRTFNGGKWQ